MYHVVGDSHKPPCSIAVSAVQSNVLSVLTYHVACPFIPFAPPGTRCQNNQVGLVEALHDHLKGKLADAGASLGGALDGQAGYGGVCADGEGVFLKAVLLYLSSEEVWFYAVSLMFGSLPEAFHRGAESTASRCVPPRNLLTL